jgi:hypothetical protein
VLACGGEGHVARHTPGRGEAAAAPSVERGERHPRPPLRRTPRSLWREVAWLGSLYRSPRNDAFGRLHTNKRTTVFSTLDLLPRCGGPRCAGLLSAPLSSERAPSPVPGRRRPPGAGDVDSPDPGAGNQARRRVAHTQQSDGLLDETIPVHSCTNTASFQTEGCATSSSQSRRSARPPPLPPDIAARDGSARSVGAHGTHHRSCLLRVPRRRPSQLHAQQPAARLRCKGEGTQTETERQSTRRGSG